MYYTVQTQETAINGRGALSDTSRENQLWKSPLERWSNMMRVDGSSSNMAGLKILLGGLGLLFFVLFFFHLKTVDTVILN